MIVEFIQDIFYGMVMWLINLLPSYSFINSYFPVNPGGGGSLYANLQIMFSYVLNIMTKLDAFIDLGHVLTIIKIYIGYILLVMLLDFANMIYKAVRG